MTRTPDTVPFVATDLSELDWPIMPANQKDVEVDGRTYRPLSPEYYAWLRSRMERARASCARGGLSPQAFDALRIRFNAIHDQAVVLFGESALLEAVRHLDPKSYPWPGRPREESEDHTHAEIPEADEQPVPRCSPEKPPSIPEEEASLDGPSSHAYPGEYPDRFRFNQPVSKHALAQVNAIREEALACGWTEVELYQSRGRFSFPCGGDYGLVCFIQRHLRLGDITDRSIELVFPDGHSLCFYRNEAMT